MLRTTSSPELTRQMAYYTLRPYGLEDRWYAREAYIAWHAGGGAKRPIDDFYTFRNNPVDPAELSRKFQLLVRD